MERELFIRVHIDSQPYQLHFLQDICFVRSPVMEALVSNLIYCLEFKVREKDAERRTGDTVWLFLRLRICLERWRKVLVFCLLSRFYLLLLLYSDVYIFNSNLQVV